MDDMEKLLNNAIVYAKSYKGVLPLLAKETGLGYTLYTRLSYS